MNRITIFYGTSKKLNSYKELIYKKINHVDYTEYDFHNVSHEDRVRFGGEGKIVINTFARFVVKTIAEIKSGKVKSVTAFVDSFIGRIDESVDITEYISPLLEVCDVFYFTDNKSDIERLKDLDATVYEIN